MSHASVLLVVLHERLKRAIDLQKTFKSIYMLLYAKKVPTLKNKFS